MALPTVPTLGTGVLTAVQLAQLQTLLDWLMSPPVFKGRQTVAQSLTHNLATAVTLDTTDEDNASGKITSTRYQLQYDGLYFAAGGISYAANATGVRTSEWWKNGTLLQGSGVLVAPVSGASTRVPTRGHLFRGVFGDYLELYAYQSSGAALNTAVATQEQASAGVFFLGR